MSNNALQTIINARLPGKEGLWQIHLHDGKISAIDAQSGVMPITEKQPGCRTRFSYTAVCGAAYSPRHHANRRTTELESVRHAV